PSADAPAGQGSVLVVDDNPDIVAVLEHYLTWKGFEVHVARDGLAALETARETQPDQVLLDLGLPALDGFAVARELRADPRFASTRLIALTGYGQAADRERALSAGFDDHVVKPPDLDHLLRLLGAGTPARAVDN